MSRRPTTSCQILVVVPKNLCFSIRIIWKMGPTCCHAACFSSESCPHIPTYRQISKILQFFIKRPSFPVSDLFPDFSENKSVKRSVIWQPKCKILSGFPPEVQHTDPRETPPLGLKWR